MLGRKGLQLCRHEHNEPTVESVGQSIKISDILMINSDFDHPMEDYRERSKYSKGEARSLCPAQETLDFGYFNEFV